MQQNRSKKIDLKNKEMGAEKLLLEKEEVAVDHLAEWSDNQDDLLVVLMVLEEFSSPEKHPVVL